MFVSTLVERAAMRWPGRPAIVDGDETLTYAQLADRVGRLANALIGLGLKPGDRLLDLQKNSHTYVECDLAAAVAGLVRIPLNTRLTVDDWSYIATNAGARALVVGAEFDGAAMELVEAVDELDVSVTVGGTGRGHEYEALLADGSSRPPIRMERGDDVVSLNYSSGTTGRPKGCVRTARNRFASTQDTLLSLFRGTLGPDDVFLHAGPLTHASGLFVLPHLAVGACQVILPRFDAEEVVRTIDDRGVTSTVLVPTMLERVLAAMPADLRPQDRFRTLRRLAYAGAPMAPDRIAFARDALAGRLVQFYGLVEAIPPVTVLTEDDHTSRELLTSAGRPVAGAALRILDKDANPVGEGEVGELLIGGDHVMREYWAAGDVPGKGLDSGWLRTGDLARRDGDGYVYLVGRRSDMIISGGYNVYPREIEDLISEDAAVAEVAVVGVPHPDWGEAVTAFVVASRGETIDVDRLRDLCAARLAAFKKPKTFHVVGELPKTAIGKISRQSLKDAAMVRGAA